MNDQMTAPEVLSKNALIGMMANGLMVSVSSDGSAYVVNDDGMPVSPKRCDDAIAELIATGKVKVVVTRATSQLWSLSNTRSRLSW